VLEVLEAGVGAREEQGLVARVTPADEIGGPAVRAVHLEDLAITNGLPHPMALDDDPISNSGLHGILLRS
jgi:hypothetical protein